jgi:hypothetical protein
MPFEVIDVQPTPNPNALKFVLNRPIVDRPTSFFNAESAKDHPIARSLFAIGGVASVLLLGDFVTVNKSSDVKWGPITAAVKKVLASAG